MIVKFLSDDEVYDDEENISDNGVKDCFLLIPNKKIFFGSEMSSS